MIYLKSCVSVIPGLEKGIKYGELVPTNTILEQMRILDDDKFDTDFVANRLGIKSVARSSFTLDLMKKSREDSRRNKKQYSLCHENDSLKEMLVAAMNLAFPDVEEKNKVIAHIHITGTAMVNHGHFLGEARKAAGIAEGRYIPTQFLIKGCSGIYDAFLISEGMISRPRKPVNILVTSDSNLTPFIGQATKRHARADNINEWLYPVIFAEGIGCAVLSNESGKIFPSMRLDYNKVDIVTEDNRVRAETIDNEVFCYIDAKGVSATYQKGMDLNIGRAIEYAGSFSNIDAMLLHESNPMLLEAVIKNHNIPKDLVPMFSDRIGTLGPVSAFQLLEEAFKRCTTSKKKIVLNVIGELFSGVNSGCIGFST